MGAFSRKETERLLLSRENDLGSYLIRESETSPGIVILVNWNICLLFIWPLWSKLKVTVTSFLYETLCHVIIHIHVKYKGIWSKKKVLLQARLCLYIDSTLKSLYHSTSRRGWGGGGIIKLNHIFNEKVDRVLTNVQWYSLGIQDSYDSKPSHYDISEKLLKFDEKSSIPSANRIT